MDSPDPRPELANRPQANPRLWLLAITVWSAFLGAALTTAVFAALLPPAVHVGWEELSVGFLCSWLVSTVPVGVALMLALPLAHHGR